MSNHPPPLSLSLYLSLKCSQVGVVCERVRRQSHVLGDKTLDFAVRIYYPLTTQDTTTDVRTIPYLKHGKATAKVGCKPTHSPLTSSPFPLSWLWMPFHSWMCGL